MPEGKFRSDFLFTIYLGTYFSPPPLQSHSLLKETKLDLQEGGEELGYFDWKFWTTYLSLRSARILKIFQSVEPFTF